MANRVSRRRVANATPVLCMVVVFRASFGRYEIALLDNYCSGKRRFCETYCISTTMLLLGRIYTCAHWTFQPALLKTISFVTLVNIA